MEFDEIRFPTQISLGSQISYRLRSDCTLLKNGDDRRIVYWSRPLRRFNVRYGIKSWEDVRAVQEFYLTEQGPIRGFRIQDGIDFSTNVTDPQAAPTYLDQVLGYGDGSTKTFQLLKRYWSGASEHVTELITKPVINSTVIGIGQVQYPPGSPTFPWSVDTTTGIVTFTNAPPYGSLVSGGCYFDIPACFGEQVNKELLLSLHSFRSSEIPNIDIYEIPDETPCLDDLDIGGAKNHGNISESIFITEAQGRVHIFNAQNTNLVIYVPDPSSEMRDGGPSFILINESTSNTVQIKEYASAAANETFIGYARKATGSPSLNATILSVFRGVSLTGYRYWLAQFKT